MLYIHVGCRLGGLIAIVPPVRACFCLFVRLYLLKRLADLLLVPLLEWVGGPSVVRTIIIIIVTLRTHSYIYMSIHTIHTHIHYYLL